MTTPSATRRRLGSHLILVVVVLVGLLSGVGLAGAAPGDIGYEGRSHSGTTTPTGSKRAESVLWWNDGSWWANMWDGASQDFHIFRLDVAAQTWTDTGVLVDSRANTRADVLWDGTHLYVASHGFVSDGSAAASGTPAYLFRFTYDPVAKTYAPDSGFPATINSYRTETLVMDKDSTGQLWATWQQGNQIYVNRTLTDDRTWGTPFVLPVTGSSVSVDDISAVLAFDGNKIGVMWSNGSSSTADGMYFAVHEDAQPDTTWQQSRTAIQGPETSDDHINLKSVQADAGGRVFAAVKTSFNNDSQPLIMLLVRDPVTGDWASHTIARVSECPNRPMVLIDEENSVLHTFYTAPAPPSYDCGSGGGAIYEKATPLDAISFATGYGTPVILDADSPFMHDVSSTKQNVDSKTGIALLAVNTQTDRYWHQYRALTPSAPIPPTADFAATPTSGAVPLAVQFNDRSSGSPTGWSWNFGDGTASTAQHPTHTYAAAGSYTVSLTVTNASGADTESRLDYISVVAPPPSFTLSVSPLSRTIVRGAETSYTITIAKQNGFTGPVQLSLSGLPSQVSVTFSPNPVDTATASTSVLRVTTSSTAKPAKYTLTIRGTNANLTRTATATLQLKRK